MKCVDCLDKKSESSTAFDCMQVVINKANSIGRRQGALEELNNIYVALINSLLTNKEALSYRDELADFIQNRIKELEGKE